MKDPVLSGLAFGKDRATIKDPFRIQFERFLEQSFPEVGELYKPVAGANWQELPNDKDTLMLLDYTTLGRTLLLTFWSMEKQIKIEIAAETEMFPLIFDKIT